MTLKAMYDLMTENSSAANRFGAISESHEKAIEQIRSAKLGSKKNYKVLDFGVGKGTFLKNLKTILPLAEFTGIDISQEMLKDACKLLSLNTIEASATEASHYLPLHSQDLVLAHFVNAYIPIDQLFSEASKLTRANGHFSLITTTYDSFPKAQEQLAQFISKDSILSTIVGHYYKSVLKNTTVALGEKELLAAFATYDFEIMAHHRISIPIMLRNIDELALFGIEGTWFLNSLSVRMLPKNFLFQRIKRLFNKIFTFPYEDKHIIDIILARK